MTNAEIRNMTRADIALGMRLKQSAGWTQSSADWQRALRLEPDGCFVAEADSCGVGTVCTCLFGPVAWIALVLVDQRWRGRGIGRALLERAIEYCEARGTQSIRLDATPLGRPLYEKLGFNGDFELARYRGVPRVAAAGAGDDYQAADLPQLITLDRAATGTDRSELLTALIEHERRPTRVIRTPQGLQGFCTGRPGADALQIGPCIADACGEQLLASALAQAGGRQVVVDVPMAHADSMRLVEKAGLLRERTFWRMTRGAPLRENLQQLWASFGPEKG
jgi:GNAT superfamily N-acetyltransferase